MQLVIIMCDTILKMLCVLTIPTKIVLCKSCEKKNIGSALSDVFQTIVAALQEEFGLIFENKLMTPLFLLFFAFANSRLCARPSSRFILESFPLE